jgi:hypothetical protein
MINAKPFFLAGIVAMSSLTTVLPLSAYAQSQPFVVLEYQVIPVQASHLTIFLFKMTIILPPIKCNQGKP